MARDAIDQSIDWRIAQALKKMPTDLTFRWQDRRTTADTLWLYVFLDDVLGHDVDRALSEWDDCFLPGELARYLPAVQVVGADGKMGSIVLWQRQLNAGVFAERDNPPASYFYGFLASGIGIGGAFCLLAWFGKRLRFFKWVFNFGVMLWSTLVGALGALLTFAWFTNHEAAKWNENWFQSNPLSLLMIVAAPMAFKWPNLARRVAVLVLALSAFGLLAKSTPWFWQVNGQIIAAALPVYAGIAWGIIWLTLRPPPVVPADKANAEVLDAA
jgi:hypothetical protein